ncbi:hypothetical protein SDC9_190718 [bioreactor metagenome]|uniref:Uncharacterized protein n=1 Tax=bioreactor metagenome TaxID=1076179 RepID=A0A645HYA1_9ZZZZ
MLQLRHHAAETGCEGVSGRDDGPGQIMDKQCDTVRFQHVGRGECGPYSQEQHIRQGHQAQGEHGAHGLQVRKHQSSR